MDDERKMTEFLREGPWAVVGASTDRAKYGNKVLRCYLQNGREAFPVHPRESEIEGLRCFPDLASLPEPVPAVSIITPPAITDRVVDEAIRTGVKHLWMQPGAESSAAIDAAEQAGLHVIAGGPCILVRIGFRE